jgi:hypothetical protein
MRQWFDWLGSAVVGGIILGLANTIVPNVLKLKPIYLFAIWFLIGFIIIAIITKWQEGRLKKSINVKREQWNKLREERIKNRRGYVKTKNIPIKLYELHTLSKRFMKELRISERQLKSIEPELIKTIGKIRAFIALVIVKLPRPILLHLKPAQSFMYKIIFDFDSALKVGGIENLREDPEYIAKNDEILYIREGLPTNIINQIDNYIMMSNMLDMLFLFSVSQPFMKKWPLPTGTKILLPYLSQAVDSQLSSINGNIAHSIERFLVGD